MNIQMDKLFEYVVAVILKRNGYRIAVPGRYLEGRGGKHQLDCVGIYPFSVPFVFPLRIVAEAKCYGRGKIGIPFVRNLHSEIIDLEQTLPKRRTLLVQTGWEPNQSCSYHGAIFSTVPFTGEAVEYANSYCIDLIPMPGTIGGKTFKEYLQLLRIVINDCLRQGSPFFQQHNQVNKRTFSNLQNKIYYSSLTLQEKNLFLKLVEWVLNRCVTEHPCSPNLEELQPFCREIFQKRMGSIEGNVVVFNFTDEEFQRLRQVTVKRFTSRADGKGNPFYPPPDELFEPEGPPEESPFGSVSVELIPEEIEKEQKKRGKFVRSAFYLHIKGEEIRTETVLNKVLYNTLMIAKFPKKVVIPVDVGCFFIGAWK